MGLGEFGRRSRPAPVDHVVKIDREQSRICADKDLAPVAGIDLKHVRRDDVFPAMIFEIVAHGVPPVASNFAIGTLAGRAADVHFDLRSQLD
jgi:hypothetical protein